MVIPPSFVRQISVPWYEIVAVPLLDIPVLKDCSLGCSVVEDRGDMHMSDLVVVLVASGSNFGSSNQDVLELSSVKLGSNGIKELSKVSILLHVESCIPLPVFVVAWHRTDACALHGVLVNDLVCLLRPVGQSGWALPTFLLVFSRFR